MARMAVDPKDRARGMMVGLAVGDAMGSPLEGLSWQDIQQRFGAVTDYRESFPLEEAVRMSGRLTRRDFDRAMRAWRMAGLYTDDAQQAIAVAYLLARGGDISGAEIAEEFVRMSGIPMMGAYFGAFRGTSDFFRTSIVTYRRQKDWKQCGVATAGNGAASRIAPAGFFYRADLDTMFWRVAEVSLVTHRDPRAIAAAYAVAWLTARLSGLDAWPGTHVLEPLALATQAAEDRLMQEYREDLLVGAEHAHDFSRVLLRADRALKTQPATILDEIMKAANENATERVSSPTGPYAPASVVTAIVAAATQGGSGFETAVTRAVALGGDTDSVGAIVGALCGVFWGLEGIPERWRDKLANSEGLVRYGDGLVDPLHRDIPDPLDAESRLCAEEERLRQAIASKVKA